MGADALMVVLVWAPGVGLGGRGAGVAMGEASHVQRDSG